MRTKDDALPDRALAAFLHAHRRRLFVLVQAKFRSLPPDRIEEACQEALTRALEAGQRMDTEHEWVTYLLVLASNYLRDELKSAYAQQVDLDGDVIERRADAFADPADLVLKRDDWHAVAQAWRALPPKQREVLALRYVEGLMPAAIAERLGVDIRAVESRLRRGKNALAAAARKRDRERQRLLLLPPPVPRGRTWFSRTTRHAAVMHGAAFSLSLLAVAEPPTLVLVHPTPLRADATAPEPASGVLRGRPGAEAVGDGDPRTTLRSPSPAAFAPKPAPSPVVPKVHVEAEGCVGVDVREGEADDAELCGGVAPTAPPPGRHPRPFVKIPAVTGQEERYVFVDSPVEETCDAMPNTPLTGCVPGEPSPAPTPSSSPSPKDG